MTEEFKEEIGKLREMVKVIRKTDPVMADRVNALADKIAESHLAEEPFARCLLLKKISEEFLAILTAITEETIH